MVAGESFAPNAYEPGHYDRYLPEHVDRVLNHLPNDALQIIKAHVNDADPRVNDGWFPSDLIVSFRYPITQGLSRRIEWANHDVRRRNEKAAKFSAYAAAAYTGAVLTATLGQIGVELYDNKYKNTAHRDTKKAQQGPQPSHHYTSAYVYQRNTPLKDEL